MLRPSVFISYAHKDGLDFTRRLAFALSLYVDVFWDRRLQAGEYPPQLMREIEARSDFLLVLTPYSAESEWCRRELSHAETHAKRVSMSMVFSPDETNADGLTSKYTYAPFFEDYEAGFRRLTMLLFGTATSSWEALHNAPGGIVLEWLKRGNIPGLISKELVDWFLVEKMWADLETYIQQNANYAFRGVPRTAIGVLDQVVTVRKQFIKGTDQQGLYRADKIINTLRPLLEDLLKTTDDDHTRCAEIAFEVYSSSKKILNLFAGARLDARAAHYTGQGRFFDFDVAEKVKELVAIHARRSRYLY